MWYIGTVLVATVLDKRGHLGKKHSRIMTVLSPATNLAYKVSWRCQAVSGLKPRI